MPRKSKNLPRTKPRIQEPAEDKAENKIRTDASKKTQISKLCSSKLLSLSQPSLLQKRWAAVLPPRGASIRRPTRDGVWDGNPMAFFFPPDVSFDQVLDLKVLGSESPAFPLLNPPPVAPGRLHLLRRSAAKPHLWRILARLGPKKSRSKRPSKTDQILMPFQHRILSVLAPFWKAKMLPKSTKNR